MPPPEPGAYEPFDHETLTIAGASTPLTIAKAAPAFMAEIIVETAELRYWKDGGAPTPTEGVLAGPSSAIYLYGAEVPRFRAVRVSATNAVAQVTYYRWPAGKRGSPRG